MAQRKIETAWEARQFYYSEPKGGNAYNAYQDEEVKNLYRNTDSESVIASGGSSQVSSPSTQREVFERARVVDERSKATKGGVFYLDPANVDSVFDYDETADLLLEYAGLELDDIGFGSRSEIENDPFYADEASRAQRNTVEKKILPLHRPEYPRVIASGGLNKMFRTSFKPENAFDKNLLSVWTANCGLTEPLSHFLDLGYRDAHDFLWWGGQEDGKPILLLASYHLAALAYFYQCLAGKEWIGVDFGPRRQQVQVRCLRVRQAVDVNEPYCCSTAERIELQRWNGDRFETSKWQVYDESTNSGYWWRNRGFDDYLKTDELYSFLIPAVFSNLDITTNANSECFQKLAILPDTEGSDSLRTTGADSSSSEAESRSDSIASAFAAHAESQMQGVSDGSSSSAQATYSTQATFAEIYSSVLAEPSLTTMSVFEKEKQQSFLVSGLNEQTRDRLSNNKFAEKLQFLHPFVGKTVRTLGANAGATGDVAGQPAGGGNEYAISGVATAYPKTMNLRQSARSSTECLLPVSAATIALYPNTACATQVMCPLLGFMQGTCCPMAVPDRQRAFMENSLVREYYQGTSTGRTGNTEHQTSGYQFVARCCCDMFMINEKLFRDEVDFLQKFDEEAVSRQDKPFWHPEIVMELFFPADLESFVVFCTGPYLFLLGGIIGIGIFVGAALDVPAPAERVQVGAGGDGAAPGGGGSPSKASKGRFGGSDENEQTSPRRKIRKENFTTRFFDWLWVTVGLQLVVSKVTAAVYFVVSGRLFAAGIACCKTGKDFIKRRVLGLTKTRGGNTSRDDVDAKTKLKRAMFKVKMINAMAAKPEEELTVKQRFKIVVNKLKKVLTTTEEVDVEAADEAGRAGTDAIGAGKKKAAKKAASRNQPKMFYFRPTWAYLTWKKFCHSTRKFLFLHEGFVARFFFYLIYGCALSVKAPGPLRRFLLHFNATARERKLHAQKMFQLQLSAMRKRLPPEVQEKAKEELKQNAEMKKRNKDALLDEVRDLLVVEEPVKLSKREIVRGDPDSRQAQKLKWRVTDLQASLMLMVFLVRVKQFCYFCAFVYVNCVFWGSCLVVYFPIRFIHYVVVEFLVTEIICNRILLSDFVFGIEKYAFLDRNTIFAKLIFFGKFNCLHNRREKAFLPRGLEKAPVDAGEVLREEFVMEKIVKRGNGGGAVEQGAGCQTAGENGAAPDAEEDSDYSSVSSDSSASIVEVVLDEETPEMNGVHDVLGGGQKKQHRIDDALAQMLSVRDFHQVHENLNQEAEVMLCKTKKHSQKIQYNVKQNPFAILDDGYSSDEWTDMATFRNYKTPFPRTLMVDDDFDGDSTKKKGKKFGSAAFSKLPPAKWKLLRLQLRRSGMVCKMVLRLLLFHVFPNFFKFLLDFFLVRAALYSRIFRSPAVATANLIDQSWQELPLPDFSWLSPQIQELLKSVQYRLFLLLQFLDRMLSDVFLFLYNRLLPKCEAPAVLVALFLAGLSASIVFSLVRKDFFTLFPIQCTFLRLLKPPTQRIFFPTCIRYVCFGIFVFCQCLAVLYQHCVFFVSSLLFARLFDGESSLTALVYENFSKIWDAGALEIPAAADTIAAYNNKIYFARQESDNEKLETYAQGWNPFDATPVVDAAALLGGGAGGGVQLVDEDKRFFCHRQESFSVFVAYNCVVIGVLFVYFFVTRGSSGRLLVCYDWFWRHRRRYVGEKYLPNLTGEEVAEAERIRVKLGEHGVDQVNLPRSPLEVVMEKEQQLCHQRSREQEKRAAVVPKNPNHIYEDGDLYYKTKKSEGYWEIRRKNAARNYHPLFGNMTEFFSSIEDYRVTDRRLIWDTRSKEVIERDGVEGKHSGRYEIDLDYWFPALAPRIHRWFTSRAEEKKRRRERAAYAKKLRKEEKEAIEREKKEREDAAAAAEAAAAAMDTAATETEEVEDVEVEVLDENMPREGAVVFGAGKRRQGSKWGIAGAKVHAGIRLRDSGGGGRAARSTGGHLPRLHKVRVQLKLLFARIRWRAVRFWQAFRAWQTRNGLELRRWTTFRLVEKILAVKIRAILRVLNALLREERTNERRMALADEEEFDSDDSDLERELQHDAVVTVSVAAICEQRGEIARFVREQRERMRKAAEDKISSSDVQSRASGGGTRKSSVRKSHAIRAITAADGSSILLSHYEMILTIISVRLCFLLLNAVLVALYLALFAIFLVEQYVYIPYFRNPTVKLLSLFQKRKQQGNERKAFYHNLVHFYLYPMVRTDKRAFSWSPSERREWRDAREKLDFETEKTMYELELAEIRKEKAGMAIEKKLKVMYDLGYFDGYHDRDVTLDAGAPGSSPSPGEVDEGDPPSSEDPLNRTMSDFSRASRSPPEPKVDLEEAPEDDGTKTPTQQEKAELGKKIQERQYTTKAKPFEHVLDEKLYYFFTTVPRKVNHFRSVCSVCFGYWTPQAIFWRYQLVQKANVWVYLLFHRYQVREDIAANFAKTAGYQRGDLIHHAGARGGEREGLDVDAGGGTIARTVRRGRSGAKPSRGAAAAGPPVISLCDEELDEYLPNRDLHHVTEVKDALENEIDRLKSLEKESTWEDEHNFFSKRPKRAFYDLRTAADEGTNLDASVKTLTASQSLESVRTRSEAETTEQATSVARMTREAERGPPPLHREGTHEAASVDDGGEGGQQNALASPGRSDEESGRPQTTATTNAVQTPGSPSKLRFQRQPDQIHMHDKFFDMAQFPNRNYYQFLLGHRSVPLTARLAKTSETKIEGFLNGFVPFGETVNLMPTEETAVEEDEFWEALGGREAHQGRSSISTEEEAMLRNFGGGLVQDEYLTNFADPWRDLAMWRDGIETVPGIPAGEGGERTFTSERRFLSFYRLLDFEQLYRKAIIAQGSRSIPLYLWFIPFFGVFAAKITEYMNSTFVFDFEPFNYVRDVTFGYENLAANEAEAGTGGKKGGSSGGGKNDDDEDHGDSSDDEDDFADQPLYRTLTKQRDDFLQEHRSDQESVEFIVRRFFNFVLVLLILVNPFIADGAALHALIS
eukprot:g5004.t1